MPTGLPGLDEILGGGLFAGGVYIIMGMPGAGKTILGNQLAFHHARTGGKAVYVTLLSETHGRLLSLLQPMSFFDPSLVGSALRYLNGYAAVESDGLSALLKLVRQVVRESKASLLVVDGMITAAAIARTDLEYKKFVQELQSWIEVVGCTVVLLTSARASELRPEYTMVDGIVELECARIGARQVRELTVVKFRGSSYREGRHAYEITREGMVLFPRFEASFGRRSRASVSEEVVGFGMPELDRLLGGGVRRGSTTLVLGSSGAGKTTLGLQFLAAGLASGERALYFGSREDPAAILAAGDALGLRLGEHSRTGRLAVHWDPASEPVLDRTGYALLSAVERSGAARLFVDGFEAVRNLACADRLAGFWAALCQELRLRGVTMLAADQLRGAAISDLDSTVPELAAADNVIRLGAVERDGDLAHAMSILKTRGREHQGGIVSYCLTRLGLRMGGGFGEDGAVAKSGASSPREPGR
jgi:circadian clock protein KaiC